mmetsp:Transcript_57585/g.134954  ORF Transcript_57585/g.134954 Transcript_57585/m.134954 type:complete len:83 (-) Transcript_57585:495-743(-)
MSRPCPMICLALEEAPHNGHFMEVAMATSQVLMPMTVVKISLTCKPGKLPISLPALVPLTTFCMNLLVAEAQKTVCASPREC